MQRVLWIDPMRDDSVRGAWLLLWLSECIVGRHRPLRCAACPINLIIRHVHLIIVLPLLLVVSAKCCVVILLLSGLILLTWGACLIVFDLIESNETVLSLTWSAVDSIVVDPFVLVIIICLLSLFLLLLLSLLLFHLKLSKEVVFLA